MSTARERIVKHEITNYILDRMVDPIYQDSEIGCAMFELIGSLIEMLTEMDEDITNQGHISKATWGLPMWAEEYAVRYSPGMTYEDLRRLILKKKRHAAPPNETNLAKYVSFQCGRDVEIVQNVGPYKFQVNFLKGDNRPFSWMKAYRAVKEARQAHLCFEIVPTYKHGYVISNKKYIIKWKPRLTGERGYRAGTYPYHLNFYDFIKDGYIVEAAGVSHRFKNVRAGLKPYPKEEAFIDLKGLTSFAESLTSDYRAKATNVTEGILNRIEMIEDGIKSVSSFGNLSSGLVPEIEELGDSDGSSGTIQTQTETYGIVSTYCGEDL